MVAEEAVQFLAVQEIAHSVSVVAWVVLFLEDVETHRVPTEVIVVMIVMSQ